MKSGSDPPFTHVEQTLLPGTDFYEQLLPFFFFHVYSGMWFDDGSYSRKYVEILQWF